MWKILKSCVTGEQHVAAHRPCQDRFLTVQTEERLICAVADGHGGTYYCRSGIGAQLACETAVEVLQANNVRWENAAGKIKESFDRKVRAHLQELPLTETERILLNGHAGEIAYGTTLICCCITPEGIYRGQIGDGELHVLTAFGKFLPNLPEDENCIGFFTTSLISPNAASQFRWAYDAEPAAVVAMYTDGYVPYAKHPWKLTDLTRTVPETIPQEILDAGQRGDDQTVLVAIELGTTETQAFYEGYMAEYIRHISDVQKNAIMEKVRNTETVIKRCIEKLATCKRIDIRGRLIEKLYEQHKKLLALGEEYRALEEKEATGSGAAAEQGDDCKPIDG